MKLFFPDKNWLLMSVLRFKAVIKKVTVGLELFHKGILVFIWKNKLGSIFTREILKRKNVESILTLEILKNLMKVHNLNHFDSWHNILHPMQQQCTTFDPVIYRNSIGDHGILQNLEIGKEELFSLWCWGTYFKMEENGQLIDFSHILYSIVSDSLNITCFKKI